MMANKAAVWLRPADDGWVGGGLRVVMEMENREPP